MLCANSQSLFQEAQLRYSDMRRVPVGNCLDAAAPLQSVGGTAGVYFSAEIDKPSHAEEDA